MLRIGTVTFAALGVAGAAASQVRVGSAAYGDWRADAPGVTRLIRAGDIPAPTARHGVAPSSIVARPTGAALSVPPGFTVAAFAKLDGPRLIRVAPNGDIFAAETDAGRIRVLRAADGAARPSIIETFASGLDRPFGIAFYPVTHPQWVYVADNNAVVRFAYRAGDVKARGTPQTVVARISPTSGHHTTRDVAFSPDGRRMFVSVGSGSNIAEGMAVKTPAEAAAWDAQHGLGASWGGETDRADVLVFDPQGRGGRIWAAGIRNCVGLAIQPATDDLWCSTNERDLLGDDVPPDYVTRVRDHGFYGWPWYYIGDHEDPRHKGERPDLAGKAAVPDVLLQPHSAPLEMVFYTAASGPAAFPARYRDDAFVALHGSWNRTLRTGYKVVRVILRNGAPTGQYQDFLTGFVVDEKSVWGRPAGVAVAHDGALLVSDDGGGVIWRVAYDGAPGAAK